MPNTVKFFAGTKANFDVLESKDANSLYIIEDAGAIYKGDKNVTSDVSLVTTVPQSLVKDKIAIVQVSASGKTLYDLYIGGAANTPIKVHPGVVDDSAAFAEDATFGSYAATVSAIKQFVNDSLTGVTGNANKAFINASFADGTLTFEPASESESDKTVELTGVAHGITWDNQQFKLTIPQYGQEANLEINIPKDFFLQEGEYVEDYEFTPTEGEPYHSPAILLTVNIQNGEEGTEKVIAIPVKDLVDTYTVGSTDTVTLTMDGQHNITAAVKFDTTTVLAGTEHILVKTATGLAETQKSLEDIATDISNAVEAAKTEIKGSLLGQGEANKVVVSTENGITRSTAAIGGATLAGTPNATTLATEAAVNAAIGTKIDAALTWNTI